jgi:hypothetical protein
MTSPLCSDFMCLMHRLHKEPVSMVKAFCLLSVIANLEGKQYINPLAPNSVYCVAGCRVQFLNHTAYVSVIYGHSFTALLGLFCFAFSLFFNIHYRGCMQKLNPIIKKGCTDCTRNSVPVLKGYIITNRLSIL